MKTLFTVFAIVLLSSDSFGAVCSRTVTFADGSVLTAANLNDEYNVIFNCVNSIDNANISAAAAILPSKFDASIAGDGIGRNGSTGVLEFNDDNSTLEISGDVVRVKDAGITGAKLATSAADGTHLEVASGSMRIKDLGVTTAKINDAAVTTAKINDGAVTDVKRASLNASISSGSGTFSTSSTTYVDVTNLSVSLTTIGRKVFITAIPATTGDGVGSSPSFQNVCFIEIERGGTEIARQYIASPSGGPMSPYIDEPAAGTYTYKIQARTLAAQQCNVTNMKLIAYEL